VSDSYVGRVQGTPTLASGQMNHLNLDTNGNLLVNIAQGSFSSTTGAVYNSAQQTFTSGTTNPLQTDSHGQLLVNAGGTLAAPLRIDPVGTTPQPVSGTVSVSGTVPVSGTFWQATQPVSGTVSVSGTVPVSGTFWQATQPVSIASTVNTSSVPAASGGLSTSKLVSAATTNATSVKASAGQVYNIQAFNTNASSPRYLKLYNKASAPTVGTDTPIKTILIPPASSGVVIEISNGLAFSTGIAFALTGAMADNDTTAIAANEVVVNVDWK